jgi:hypothetical protein
MSGYAGRKHPSEGVDLPLSAKALVLQHGKETPLLLITADIIGFPRAVAETIASRVEKEAQLPRENILLVGSHTHTGPVIAGSLTGMYALEPKDAETVEKYREKLQDQILVAVRAALKDRSPARLSFGRSKAGVAINRRVFRSTGVNFGANPDGVVDPEVPVLRIDGPDGKVRAIIFGYACHCTTLGGDYYRISGDWAGFAQDYLERAHPGATALFVTGCGGDANPEPRGQLDFARQHGLEIAGAVCQVLKGPRTPIEGTFRASFDRVNLPFAPVPSRAEYAKRLEDKSVYVRRHAKQQLDVLDSGGQLPTSYPCPVQAWQLGKDLTLVGLGGEVVADYSLRLKREIKGGNLWVAGYCNDVFAYVPSVRILLEGGYEADFNLIYYGLPTRFSNDVEEILVKAAKRQVEKVR